MMKTCDTCNLYDPKGWPNKGTCFRCHNMSKWEKKPMTQADRIRAMSDEELADYLRYYNDSYARYDMDWLDWLRQAAE